MTNAALLQSLAESLLPGVGFFGGTPDFALKLHINKKIDSLVMFVDAGHDEFLNLGRIVLFDELGNEIDKRTAINSASMSSNYENHAKEKILEEIIAGSTIHSASETRPTLILECQSPVFVSKIMISNRHDRYGRRSRYLNLTAKYRQDVVFRYANFSVERQLIQLIFLLIDIGINIDFPTSCEMKEIRQNIEERIIERIENNTLGLNLERLCQLLPLLDKKPALTDFHVNILAEIIKVMLDNKSSMETKRLAPLQEVLSSDLIINRVQQRLNAISRSRPEHDRSFAMSKHRLQEPQLEKWRDEFLAGLKQIISDLEQKGIVAMICYGTLLGAVRQDSFLCHDDDVDVLYVDGSENREDALRNKANLIIYLKGKGYSIWDAGENFQVSIGNIYIDLFPSWRSGNDIVLMMERFKYRNIPSSLILPPSTSTLYGQAYPAPADRAGFLAQRYGDNWMVADPYHEWPWRIDKIQTITDPQVILSMQQRKRTCRKRMDRTCLIAWGQHVGPMSDPLPKNSIPLIKRALELRFDAIELDIRVSSDGIAVLAHDDLLHGLDGNILINSSKAEEIVRFRLGTVADTDVRIPTLEEALNLIESKDVLLDPRMQPGQLQIVRDCVDKVGFDRSRLQFCVYNAREAEELLKLFPESVLLWKIGLPFQDVTDIQLDEAAALGMDGVMLIWPLYDEDFSQFMNKLRSRGLRVLFYLHNSWPKRPRQDRAEISFENMVRENVDYITTIASHLSQFKQMVGLEK